MNKNINWTALAKQLLRIIGFVIFAVLVVKIRPATLLVFLADIPPLYLGSITLLVVGFYLLCGLRLKILAGSRLDYLSVLDIWIKSGLLGFVTGIRGSSIGAKVGFLKLKGGGVSGSLAGAGLEVIYDIMLAFAVMLIFFATNGTIRQKLAHVPASGAKVILGVSVALILSAALYFLLGFFFKDFMKKIYSAFGKSSFSINMSLTFFIWATSAVAMMLYFRAMGYPISLWFCLAAVSAGYIAGLVSFIPSGMGVYEVTSSYVVSLTGVPIDTAISVTVLMRFVTIFVAMVMLFFMHIFFNMRLGRVKQLER